MEHLQGVVETGEATEDTYTEMCDIENAIRERVRDYIEWAPKYDGNPEIMFDGATTWKLHLHNDEWETVPDKDVKDAGFMHHGSS